MRYCFLGVGFACFLYRSVDDLKVALSVLYQWVEVGDVCTGVVTMIGVLWEFHLEQVLRGIDEFL